MVRKSGLGRGLGALIPGAERVGITPGINYLSIDQIMRNPHQPRSAIEQSELEELSDSIKEHGLLQPVIVSYDEVAGKYVLIAGERRLLASQMAGLEIVPAIIREVSEQQRLELALVENLQRSDLGALDEAEAYRELSEDYNLSHEEIAQKIGKSRTAVTNTLRLLKLPDTVKQALKSGQISEGHARALLALTTPQAQQAVLQTIEKQALSVRQTEELVRRLSGAKPPQTVKPTKKPELLDIEDRLRRYLGTKVILQNRQKGGGTIIIHYYSDEELNSLIQTILGEL